MTENLSQREVIRLSKILIFAGTTEGRKLSEHLCEKRIEHTVCVATEYGEIVLQENPYATVHMGRMDSEEMSIFFAEQKCEIVVDATHPYAAVVTENIKHAVESVNHIKYLRLKRDTDISADYDNIRYFFDNEMCAKALKNTDGNILLTTGSKELPVYCAEQSVKERLYVRVLPGIESISLCMQNEIAGKHILALQGPFSTELNEALIDQYDIKCLVTKKSGVAGGWNEKIAAAKNKGIPVFVVGQGVRDDGMSFDEVCEYLDRNYFKREIENVDTGFSLENRLQKDKSDTLDKEVGIDSSYNTNSSCNTDDTHNSYDISNRYNTDKICTFCRTMDKNKNPNIKFHILLAGIGMGNTDCMTGAVAEAIKNADILLGARRMIEKYDAKIDKKPYYLADQIIPYLHEFYEDNVKFSDVINVIILFSGDTGFYSGSRKLYAAIKNEITTGKLDADVSVLPGISSVSYMAAAIGETYSDAYICSIHGVKLSNITSRLSHHAKTFMLMSGVKDVNMLGQILSKDEKYGLKNSIITVGYQLSYPDEKIMQLSPQECMQLQQEGLYICMIKNTDPVAKNVTPHIKDAEFIREKVPMTKEEIRHISICKLDLKSDSVLYDVGSGTGSIAVEAASLSDDIEVYAIEQKENAIQLITQNKEKFGLDNIHVVGAKAPDGMDTIPTPTHAFIGGSGGNLKDIIESLKAKNPHIRIVINAISMETICEIKEILSTYDVKNEDIVQMQVSRSKQIGHYHLMQAENPVWICSFEF